MRKFLPLLFLALSGCPQPSAPPPEPVPGNVVEQIDILHDEYRRGQNLPPLTRLESLDRIAQQHSINMERTFMSHAGFSGRCREATKITSTDFCAENVAKGYTSANSVMSGWWRSAGHKRNILSKNAQYIGVGVAGKSYTVLFK